GKRGVIDKETYGSAIWIAVIGSEQHRLLGRLGFAPRSVRKKAIVAVDPQMRIKRLDALLGRTLHDNFPTSLQRFLKERGQYALKFLSLQVVKQYLGHRIARPVPTTFRNDPHPADREVVPPNRNPNFC